MGQLLLQSAVILWMVQLVCTGGYSSASGVSTGQGPQPNGNKPQNGGGVGRMLIPSKGVGHTMGPQNGYRGYPSKGLGYGPMAGVSGPNGVNINGYGTAAGVANGRIMKGYGAAAGGMNGQGNKPQGYGGQAGQANGQPMKGNGYNAHAGGYGGRATKGLGQGTAAGVLGGNGVRAHGQGGVGSKPMKGYGRPYYGTGPGVGVGTPRGVGVGTPRGVGVPQLARNQGRAFNTNGYTGYGAQPVGGYTGGYGHAGLSLGPHYGNGGMKGPMRGSSGVASVPNGQGAKPNGYAGARAPVRHGAIPNGHGYPHGGTIKPGNAGYGPSIGGAVRPIPGFGNGAAHPGYGRKPTGYDGATGQQAKAANAGHGYPHGGATKPANTGYGMMPNGKSAVDAGATNGKGQKGGVAQPSVAPLEAGTVQQAMTQGKSHKQTPLILQATPEPAPAFSQGTEPLAAHKSIPDPAFTGPQGKGSTLSTPVVPQSNPEPEPARNQGNKEASLTKGQAAKTAKADCGPSGKPNGQWMKISRPDYNAGAGGSTGMRTKGYGASAGGFLNGGGAKANKPGYGAGGFAVPGLSHGYGAGLIHPYAGYGQGPYVGGGYGIPNGGNADVGKASKSKSGFGNGYNAGVQPDYASLGQGAPTADAQPGAAAQVPYNGAPIVPVGLDGVSQLEPQSAGLIPNGKLSSMYAGMGGLHFGGHTFGMGAEKSSKKYGIGGLLFGGQHPLSAAANGAGQYGYGAGAYGPTGHNGFPSNGQLLGHGSTGHVPGKYGYGRMSYEAQPAELSPEAISASKYDNHGLYNSHPLESTSEARAGGEYDAAALMYESMPTELHSAAKSYVKGVQQLSPAAAAESAGLSVDRYDNAHYINGRVQPQVVAYPGAPTLSPTPAYDPSLTEDTVPGIGVEDSPRSPGPVDRSLDSAPATETQGVVQVSEQPDDLAEEQLPRQIHIQQQLKLHFHPQGTKNSKHDLNGFFGNSGYQG